MKVQIAVKEIQNISVYVDNKKIHGPNMGLCDVIDFEMTDKQLEKLKERIFYEGEIK